MIFKTSLKKGKVPLERKKSNVVPIHKKGDKQIAKNYRLVSLLTKCGKIFERLSYNVMYDALSESKLLSSNHSEFYIG